jgi:DNA-binding transcriptional MocR family regulator
MCRERRAVWKARIEIQRRGGRITDGEAYVGLALLKRLGQDGRCDPSHQTLADDSGESVSTVQRALKALLACGMVSWMRRLVRDGWRASQTSNAYLLTLGETPEIPALHCDVQTGRETRQDRLSSMQAAAAESSPAAQREAQAALARVRAQRQTVVQARLLGKGRAGAPA